MLEVPADSSHEPALFALLARSYIDQRVSRYRRAIASRPAMCSNRPSIASLNWVRARAGPNSSTTIETRRLISSSSSGRCDWVPFVGKQETCITERILLHHFTSDDVESIAAPTNINRHLRPFGHDGARNGLTIFNPAKSFSLSVTTTHSFASPMAAMIMSSALLGRPFAVPSAISRAQISPGF